MNPNHNADQAQTDKDGQAASAAQTLSLEDRALKYIETHNTQIWIGIAILAVVVVLIKRNS
ncbi:MAG: hypothetical protein RLZZ470_1000 [Pseudomonadota bacterium]|jgi:hypothetical protein